MGSEGDIQIAPAPLLAIVFCIAGCVSPSTQQEIRQTSDVQRSLTQNPQLLTYFDLADGPQSTVEEQRVADAFGPVCERGYSDGLIHGMTVATQYQQSTGSFEKVYALPSFARQLDAQFEKCLNSFGATGYPFVRLNDGRDMRVPNYLEALIAASEARGAAISQAIGERRASAAVLTAAALMAGAATSAVNPRQTYVGSYRRSNGDFVRGHWRTMPNSTCWDNLSGC